MRILVLNYEYPPLGGGAAPVTASLCQQLAARGHQLDIITMAFSGLPPVEESENLTIHRVPCRRQRMEISTTKEMASYLLPAYRKARELSLLHSYDLIHAHFIIPTGLVATAIKRNLHLPLVVTAHGSDVPGYNPHRFKLEHIFIKPLWKRIIDNIDLLICPSRSLSQLIGQNYSGDKLYSRLQIVPNGVMPFGYHPSIKIPGRVLMSGRLLERKGFRTMLHALQINPLPMELHIVGDGPDRALLMKMADDVTTPVIFHGWLNNTSPSYRELFETASIFVFPSEIENFPVVLLEAMSAGLAILTADVGGCAEVVGDTAEFIHPNRPDELYEKMSNLLADHQRIEAMGIKAYTRVMDHFTWDHIATAYEKLFRTAIASD